MSKFKSAVHNFGHHAVSGLSNFLQDAYEACEAVNIWAFEVDLLSGICTQSDLNSQERLRNAIAILKNKHESILTSTSGVRLDDVMQASVEIDFLVNDMCNENRKSALKDIGVWYGHDPIYRFTVSVQLNSGQLYQEIFKDNHK